VIHEASLVAAQGESRATWETRSECLFFMFRLPVCLFVPFFFVFFVVSISKGGIVCTEWKKASSGTTSLKISDRIPKFTVMDTRGLSEILKV
jgi:hypothetical protein